MSIEERKAALEAAKTKRPSLPNLKFEEVVLDEYAYQVGEMEQAVAEGLAADRPILGQLGLVAVVVVVVVVAAPTKPLSLSLSLLFKLELPVPKFSKSRIAFFKFI